MIAAAAAGLIAVAWASAASAGKRGMVGGPCSYEEFPGRCVVSGRDASGRAAFSFEGIVDGAEARLDGNMMYPGMGARKDAIPCRLMFIRKGTCTPCAFTIGECGRPAWELFRSRSRGKR